MKIVVIYCGGHFLVPETSSDTLLRPCLEPRRRLKTAGDAGLGESLLTLPPPRGTQVLHQRGRVLDRVQERIQAHARVRDKRKS